MIVLLTILLGTALSSVDIGTEIDCKGFKTGEFRLIDTDQEYLIERNDTIQIEKDLKKKTISKFKVTWVTECEYELNILEGREEVLAFFKDKTLSIRILQTFKNGYKYGAKLKGTEMTLIHSVERVD